MPLGNRLLPRPLSYINWADSSAYRSRNLHSPLDLHCSYSGEGLGRIRGVGKPRERVSANNRHEASAVRLHPELHYSNPLYRTGRGIPVNLEHAAVGQSSLPNCEVYSQLGNRSRPIDTPRANNNPIPSRKNTCRTKDDHLTS